MMFVIKSKKKLGKYIANTICVASACVLLSGCGLDPWEKPQTHSQQGQSWGMPGAVSANTLPDKKPQAKPAQQMHTKPAGFKPRGLNLQDYFAYDIKNPIERTRRAEQAVIALEKQVVELQHEIVKLKQQQAYQPHPSSYAKHEPAHTTPQQISPKPKMKVEAQNTASKMKTPAVPVDMSGPLKISQFRVGEHSDRTRLVFDANRAVKYSYDIDNAEKLLVIELQDAAWSKSISQAVAKSSLVAGYSTYDGGDGGTTMVVQLKKQTQVVKEAIIQPNNISPYYRLVIDLSK